MRRLWIASFLLAWFTALPAAADYYYAVAVGEKRFTSRESHDYRATRATMGTCAAELDPVLCREVLLERVEGRWESEVIGTKGFYASDRDRKSRAERRALTACRADVTMQSCRLRESPRPERASSPDDDAARGLESILEGLLR